MRSIAAVDARAHGGVARLRASFRRLKDFMCVLSSQSRSSPMRVHRSCAMVRGRWCFLLKARRITKMAVLLLCILVLSHVTLVRLFANFLRLLPLISVKRLFGVSLSRPFTVSWSRTFSRFIDEKYSVVWCVGPSDHSCTQVKNYARSSRTNLWLALRQVTGNWWRMAAA